MSEKIITLTGHEIEDLAEMVGININGFLSDEERETEITIFNCPPKGFCETVGNRNHSRYVAICDGCDLGERFPLGKMFTRKGQGDE